jgi:deazaflavin-dependent oxidoreductase (nitroreductase family)
VQVTLTTMGRRSGQPRPVRLYAWENGSDLVVVGSRGGAAHDPAWVANLRANPLATVTRGRRDMPIRGREVAGEEREGLWRLIVERFPPYERYQRRTDRRIPLFVLEPADER